MGAGASALTDAQREALVEEGVLYISNREGLSNRERAAGHMLKTLAKMRKAGVPLAACIQRARISPSGFDLQVLSDDEIARFVSWCERRGNITSSDIAVAFPSASVNSAAPRESQMFGEDPTETFKPDIRVLEKYRILLGGKGLQPVSKETRDAIQGARLNLIRQAFAGETKNIFANLCARDKLHGMFKGVKLMRCNAETLVQYCTRWRDFNCEDDPVDKCAVDLWLEICLPAWETRTRYRNTSWGADVSNGKSESGGESKRK